MLAFTFVITMEMKNIYGLQLIIIIFIIRQEIRPVINTVSLYEHCYKVSFLFLIIYIYEIRNKSQVTGVIQIKFTSLKSAS